MKIAVLGAGAFGTALGGILAANGYDIDYYDSKLEKEVLSDNLATAEYIVLCVPSKVVPFLLPHVRKDKPMIVATKGLLTDDCFADFEDWMVLSGPGFAGEIKDKKKTYFTITDERIKTLLDADYVEFDETNDQKGVLMCGALKNVYAMLAGYKRIEPGSKENKEFLKAAALEMKKLLETNAADAKTVDLECGIGDLKLTCAPESRNYTFGYKLSHDANYVPDYTVEGISAIKRIKRGDIEVPEDLPLLKEVLDIIWQKD